MASLYSLEGDALDGKGKGSVVSFKGMVSGLVKENGYTLCLTSSRGLAEVYINKNEFLLTSTGSEITGCGSDAVAVGLL